MVTLPTILLSTLAAVAVTKPTSDKLVWVGPRPGECGLGCVDTLKNARFNDMSVGADPYEAVFLSSRYWLQSCFACIVKYCPDPKEQAFTWKEITVEGEVYSNIVVPPMDEIRRSIDMSSIPTVDILANPTAIYNQTILVSYTNWRAGWRTEREWNQQMSYHHAYGWALYILLGIMVLIGIFNRAWTMWLSSRAKHLDPEQMTSSLSVKPSIWQRVYTWYRGSIGVPACFGYRHMQAWGFLSIPTRIEGILICIYCAINFIWSCTNYHVYDDNMYWYHDKPTQLCRYIADRTGIMSFYNLPLLWVLAGRNDVLIWVTGWSYSSCNLFHRWAARIATLQAIAHSAGYTWLDRDSLAEVFKERYWATGIFATVTMSIMIPLSIRPFREKLYETFLMLHIALALATLVLLFYHVEIFEGQYDGYLWACIAVWLFDRVLRIIRVCILSFNAFRIGQSNTVASLTEANNLLRLSVKSSVPLSPKPGSYYFLYSPLSIAPWENHPFTLASWNKDKSGTTLNFLMKTEGGATRRMHKRIGKVADRKHASMTILLEGPYGTEHHLEFFDHVLFVAGGAGVTAILPYIFELGKRPRVRIQVVWAVQNMNFASDVLAHELSPQNVVDIPIDLYLSRDGSLPNVATSSSPPTPESPDTVAPSSPVEKLSSHDYSGIKFPVQANLHCGRPDVPSVLARSISQVRGAERLAVMGCGPSSMMDDLRRAVAHSYGTDDGQLRGSQLEYFEEAFNW